jgi:hypothetical protein
MKLGNRILSFSLLWLSTGFFTHAQDLQEPHKKEELAPSDDSQPCPLDRNITQQAKFNDYVIRVFRWPQPSGCLRISKNGKLVYSLESGDFKIGGNFFRDPGLPLGTGVTSRGIPEAVVGEWTGGAHCCFILHILELGEHFHEIAKIEADDSDGAGFQDLNHDGHFEFVGYDWVFAYWQTSFMQSPAPKIVLRYSDGRFRLATDLMQKPVPSEKQLAATAEQIRNDEWGKDKPDPQRCGSGCGVPSSLSKNMLDLIYTGHADPAWRLLDQSWPPLRTGKPKFAHAFCAQLKQSHYWQDLKDWANPCQHSR